MRTLAVWSLVFISTATMRPTAVAQAAPGNEYLFVVDTSFSMVRNKSAVADAISKLIASGLSGRMQAGDRLALWTFNESVRNARLPSETWSPETSRALADQAARIVKTQWFEKQTRLETAMAEIQKAAKTAKQLTVVILSDGDSPLTGTPFDRSVNLIYRDNYRELRRGRKPFVTTLVASDGQFVAWAVAIGGGAIKVPEVPSVFRSARLETNRAPSSVAAPFQEGATPKVVAEAPKPGSTSRETREILGSENTQTPTAIAIPPGDNKTDAAIENPAALTLPNPARTDSSNAVVNEANQVAQSPRANPTGSGQASDEIAATKTLPSSSDAEAATPPQSTNALPQSLTPPPSSLLETGAMKTPLQAEERPSGDERIRSEVRTGSAAHDPSVASSDTTAGETPPQQVAIGALDSASSRGLASLLAGLSLLAVALGLLSWSIRNRRPRSQPSIISRSIERKDGRRSV